MTTPTAAMNKEPHYVSLCAECGSLTGWISRSCSAKDQSKFVRESVILGDVIDRMPIDEVRKANWKHAATCSHYRPKVDGLKTDSDKQTELFA